VTTFTFEEELLGVDDGDGEPLGVDDGDGEPLGVGPGAQPVRKSAAVIAAPAFRIFMALSYCSRCQVEK